MKNITTKDITRLAMMLGILIVLELLEGAFFKMPQGGSLSISSIIFMFFITYLTFSEATVLFLLWRIVILIFVPPYVVSPIQFILEYFIAYSGFLLTYSFVKNKNLGMFMASSAVANIVRYIIHSLAGVFFFAAFAVGPVWQYSFGYNLTYMLPTLVVHLVLIVILIPSLKKINIKM